MLSRYSRAMACVRRYSNDPTSGKSAILWPGCIVQQMNAVKPPVSSCRSRRRSRCSMRSAIGLDVAEHHRAGALAAELVPDAAHFEPLVGERLALRQFLADAIDEDLAAAAGQAAEAGVLQAPQHLSSGSLLILWKCQISGGLKACRFTFGIAGLQVAEQFLVPFELERRVHAALHQDLVAAEGDRLLDLLVELLARQDVGVGVARLAVERAEVADRGADVGVVDVAVDVVGAVRLGVQPHRDRVGGPAELVQVAARNSSTPSSGVRRSPSAAFARMRSMVVMLRSFQPIRGVCTIVARQSGVSSGFLVPGGPGGRGSGDFFSVPRRYLQSA